MSTQRSKRGNAREARRAKRAITSTRSVPYITRRVPVYEMASEELLTTIETNAETLLEETGIDFRDDPPTLSLFENAGAKIDGERVRFPRNMCKEIIQASAPRMYVCWCQLTDHLLCTIWIRGVVMQRLRTSKILPS